MVQVGKTDLRKSLADQRRALPRDVQAAAAERIRASFFQNIIVPPGAIVAGYWPVNGEVDVRPILKELSKKGHVVALPRVTGRTAPLSFVSWTDGASMTDGAFGVPVPSKGKAVIPDIFLVPLTAFDALGNRLGYGGGFYDRTISALKKARPIGVAYELQKCDNMPVAPHDARLSAIITEENFYDCGKKP